MSTIDSRKYIKVCHTYDLREGEGISVKIFPKTAAVFKINGKFYGIEGLCKHQKASLVHSGKLSGYVLRCLRHGWEYDVKSGKCLSNDYGDIKTYEILIDDSTIYLNKHDVLNDFDDDYQ